jgi:hypothetical protein
MERAEREMVSMAKCLLGKLLDKWAGCLFPDKQHGGRRLVSTMARGRPIDPAQTE